MVDRQKANKSSKSITLYHNAQRKKKTAIYSLHFDSTLTAREESRFNRKHGLLIQRLAKGLKFTYNEVKSILSIYYKFQKRNSEAQGAMTGNQFQSVLHHTFDITDSEITARITRIFSDISFHGKKYISMESWVKALSLFLRGTMEEKIRFCYSVYSQDVVIEENVSQSSIAFLLTTSVVGEEDREGQVGDIVSIILHKMDVDRDGTISLDDFRKTVLGNPIMLEALGQCLPSRFAVQAFTSTFIPCHIHV